MACYRFCSPYLCTSACDDSDAYEPWDCFDTCTSTCYIQPRVYRLCSAKCQPSISLSKTQGCNSTNGGTESAAAEANSEKFCVHVNIRGFDQESVKMKVENGKLIVEANQEDRQDDEEYTIRQFKRTYQIPKQADPSRLTSRMVSDNILLIEAPFTKSSPGENCLTQGEEQSFQNGNYLGQAPEQSYQNRNYSGQGQEQSSGYGNDLPQCQEHSVPNDNYTGQAPEQSYPNSNYTGQAPEQSYPNRSYSGQGHMQNSQYGNFPQSESQESRDSLASYVKLLISADFHPCIADLGGNRKALQMTIDVKNCQLEDMNVSIENNELVVRGQCKHKENHHSKRARFFRSTTLPAGAQTQQMTKQLDKDGQLKIQIPIALT
ncbi:unnamed protein product [Adineta ricciae]|uniref:SHSP domain-containing protein n=1 Tax=Adineta ricciae TaxID=249248 RepID=A0A814Z8Y4_ADIRI|nr:unnamed protein product [Adineta ricciae]